MTLTPAGAEIARSAANSARQIVQEGTPPGLPEDWLLRMIAVLDDCVPHAAISLTESAVSIRFGWCEKAASIWGWCASHRLSELEASQAALAALTKRS